MVTASNQGLTKLTTKLYAPMYATFDRQLSEALLRRDAFLDRMIAQEIPHLREDLKGKRLSPEAHRYISHSLKNINLKKTGEKNADPLRQVSIAVRIETAAALKSVVEEHNLVRDAFLNRLIILLLSSNNLLKALELPRDTSGFGFGQALAGTDSMPTSPLRAIEAALLDPFYYLRAACENIHGCGLSLLEFPSEAIGMYCYLDDDQVPGTPAHKERKEREKEREKELALLFGDFEANLTPVNKTQGA